MWHTTTQIYFPGLFLYVYIENPNPKNPTMPRTTGPKPHRQKALTPKTQSKTPTPNSHKIRKYEKKTKD